MSWSEQPSALVAVKTTSYTPVSVKVWEMELPLPEVPSPKSHDQVFATGVKTEESVNTTGSGKQPPGVSVVKFAIGNKMRTPLGTVSEFEQPLLSTKLME